MATYAFLSTRGLLAVSGEDRVAFLQGLTSNDVNSVSQERAVFSALLTPQGKFLHDFFITARGDALLLDCEADRRDDLMRRLRMYRLRSRVELEDRTEDFTIAVVTGDDAPELTGLSNGDPGEAAPFADGISYVDPRTPELGIRIVLPSADTETALQATGAAPGDVDSYDELRLSLGVPDGSRDLLVEKSTLLESNYDTWNAISWDKGCYLGQELTARMNYRGLVKKRLMPVSIAGPLPPNGTPITLDGREVGEVRSGRGTLAIALLRLDAADRCSAPNAASLIAGEATVTVGASAPSED